MPLEPKFEYIADFNTSWPNNDPDQLAEADDHLRGIKSANLGSFPNLGQNAVTKTALEINNLVDGTGGTIDGATFTGTQTGFAGDVTGNLTGNADTVTTNADLTGEVTSVGNVASLSPEMAPWVEISTGVVATGTIDIENIDNTYAQYMLVLKDVLLVTAGASLLMRIGTGATPDYQGGATQYSYQILAGIGSSGADRIVLAETANNDASSTTNGTVLFSNPESIIVCKRFLFNLSYARAVTDSDISVGTGAFRSSNTAITAVRFLSSSGSVASGAVTLYGLK